MTIGAIGPKICWFHKIANVLNCLPKSAQPGAKAALAEIWNAEDREHAEAAVKAFAETYGAKWPKAVAKITEDLDVLLAFYDYPAEHWVHLRTTNPIERLNREIRRRTDVVGIFPDRSSAIRLIGAVLAEQHDDWIEGRRYLGLDVLARSRMALITTDQPTTTEKEDMTPAALTA